MATDRGNNKQRNRRPIDLSTMVYGKVPPQAKDLEEVVLGAILLEKTAIDKVIDILTHEVFYVEAHQRIFQSMFSLHQKSQPIDILTVCEELRRVEELEMCGGAYYITKLTNSVVSSANIETHARIVYQKYLQREMIKIGGMLIDEGFQDSADVFEILDQAEKHLYEVSNALHKKNFVGMDTLLVRLVTELEHIRQHQEDISGVTSGFRCIDKLTHGWQKTDLIILAARPGVGKTAFALNLARNAAMGAKRVPVGFFSLEMSAGQLTKRLLSAETEFPLEKIMKGRVDDNEMKEVIFKKGIGPLSSAGIFIDDTAGMNVFELRAKARRMKAKHGIGLIIIDYLQLMSGIANNGRQNREQEISEISRNLKKLAKELDIPIIALSQLSRETEKRADKSPQLSDLRESGAIEQDADAVIFMYRAEYYGINKTAEGESTVGKTVLKFAKYRNGSPGSVELTAQLWIQKFIEHDDMPFPAFEKKKADGRTGVTTTWLPFKEDQIDNEDTVFNK